MSNDKYLRIKKWSDEISKFSSKNGFDLLQRTEYHVSVFSHQNRIDFYPVRARYHNLKTNERGDVTGDLLKFLNTAFEGELG